MDSGWEPALVGVWQGTKRGLAGNRSCLGSGWEPNNLAWNRFWLGSGWEPLGCVWDPPVTESTAGLCRGANHSVVGPVESVWPVWGWLGA